MGKIKKIHVKVLRSTQTERRGTRETFRVLKNGAKAPSTKNRIPKAPAWFMAWSKNFLEPRLDHIDRRLNEFNQRLEVVEHRLEVVEKRLEVVEKRLDNLEKRVNGMDDRLSGVIKLNNLKDFD